MRDLFQVFRKIAIALSKNVELTVRVSLVALIVMHFLAYQFGGFFIPMLIILSVWGFIHTGGFLMANLHVTHGLKEPVLDFVNSLLASFFNAGITLGTILGGFVIVHYGIHEVVWISIPLFGVSFLLTFITKKETSMSVDAVPEELFNEDTAIV